jgi:hypothetical protein
MKYCKLIFPIKVTNLWQITAGLIEIGASVAVQHCILIIFLALAQCHSNTRLVQ